MKTEIDTLLNGKVKIVQFEKGVKVSSDAVLLASVIDNHDLKKKSFVLDVGVGGGGISLCLLKRFNNINILGIDIQSEMLNLANESILLNDFQNRCSLLKENIFKSTKNLKNREFDIVITNPPFYKGNSSPDIIKAKSHSELGLDLGMWIKSSIKRLKNGGSFAIIHKADRIDDIIFTLKSLSMGKIEIFPLYSKKGEISNRIIIKAKKGYKTPSIIYPEIILHKDDGEYTNIAKSLLEDGKSLYEVLSIKP